MAGWLGFLKYVKGSPKIAGNLTVDGTLTQTGAATFAAAATFTGAVTYRGLMDGEIADPGASGAIVVTDSGVCPITTAGAEARTIAIPTFVGQNLSISLDVDGGDCTVTVAAAVNQAGNNTLTGQDAGDHIWLTGVQVGGALVWRVVANDGWGLTTV